MKKYRFLDVAITLVLAFFCAGVAYAADTAPETVAQATSETTKVTWAYGAVLQQWASAISAGTIALVALLLRNLPSQVYAIIVAARVDQMLNKGINYGINQVANASKDKALTVDVRNKVLAQAAQYVIDNAPGWLQSWMGGPEAIVKKIIARLNIQPEAPPVNVAEVAAQLKTS